MPASDDDVVHVALTDEGCARPLPLHVEYRWHLVSCLHAVGVAFACQSMNDTYLNSLIEVLENERTEFPFESSQSLLQQLKRLDWRLYMAEVADMHGDIQRDWYRKTTLWVIDGLGEAVKRSNARQINYVRWGT